MFAHINDVKAGSVLITEDGFTCMKRDEEKEVYEDDEGLFIYCSEGTHYLDGQLDAGVVYIGLTLKGDK